MVRFAIFGDTHGHLRLMFQLARFWQKNHGVHLDGILQCGDLGFFPNPDMLDKATRKFADRDPEELGFSRYFVRPEPPRTAPPRSDPCLERTLRGDASDLNTVRCPVIFCHGNHEDFQALERLPVNQVFVAVDVFDRVHLLRSGYIVTHAGLQLAALGGGVEPEGVENDHGLAEPWKWVGYRACERLLQLHRGAVDMLLAHCAPHCYEGGAPAYGSKRLRQVIEHLQPTCVFFSHHKGPIAPYAIGRTNCFWLNDVNFATGSGGINVCGNLNSGCMGILEWETSGEYSFDVVAEPWFAGVTPVNWQAGDSLRPGG
ncbi:MAG: metallophosphoesterase [Candidatus Eisenbacteria sp.]|nr:metallophosphoesterase [Candidatus Eisenbacteria bacterium]